MKNLRPTRPWLLVGLLVSSEILYLAMLRLDAANGVRPVITFLSLVGLLFALYATACWIVREMRENRRCTLFIIATGAVLFRLTLLPAGLPPDSNLRTLVADLRADIRGKSVTYERFLLYDSDLWRYLWDGHVSGHGVNPYLYAPADPALDRLADEGRRLLTEDGGVWADIRDNINYANTQTIYPPLAQGLFRLAHALAPGSVLAMKSLVVVLDLLGALFIALTLHALGRSPFLVILYAWNPLVIKVFAGSGHVDSLLVATLAATIYFLARGARRMGAISFALAVLSKLSPVLLLPIVARRIGWRNTALAGLVLLGGVIPFLGAGATLGEGFQTFAREWQFNACPFALVSWLAGWVSDDPSAFARILNTLAILGITGWMAWRDDGRRETFAWYSTTVLGALIILSPTVMLWYVTWVIVPAIVADKRAWIYFFALVCLAFLVMVDGTEDAWVLGIEYCVFLAIFLRFEFRLARVPGRRRKILLNRIPGPLSAARDRTSVMV